MKLIPMILYSFFVYLQVGEHLLSLLQELETFASSNTIENLIRLSDDADSLVSKAWKPLRNVLELSDVSCLLFDPIECVMTFFCILCHRMKAIEIYPRNPLASFPLQRLSKQCMGLRKAQKGL
jgi:hypothetical protein